MLICMTIVAFGQQEIIEKSIEKEVTVNVEDGIKTITIVKTTNGNEEVIEWRGGVDEELPANVAKEMADVEVIVEDEAKPDQKKMKVVVMEVDSTRQMQKWEGNVGDELPADIQKVLDEHNIDLDQEIASGKGEKKMKVMKIIDENGNEQIIEWNGEGRMPREMREKDHEHMRKHNTMGYDKRGGRGDKFNGRGYSHKYGNKAKLGIEIEETAAGVVVNDVMEGSGAKVAGMQQGDIITVVDDTSIDNLDRLYAELATHNPGDTVKVKVMRGGSTKKLNVTLK